MNKRMKHIVCTGMMIVSMLSFANGTSSLDNHKEPTVITFDNVKKGHQLVIKDANLLIVYKESIQKNGSYAKGFDLTSLPDGNYYVELDKDVKIVVIPFTVASNKVTFDKKNETVIYKPTVRLEDNYLFVSRLSLDVAPLKMKLYYTPSFQQGKELLFSEEVENTKIMERIFELSKEKKGSYTVFFESQGREFSERIKF
ncbi:hypothetical protein KORDIASMS9_01354 [Kordia sp. SMS9]|uniref:hypothetical protein n=1 Tax=Kordia sp. SMS9 TaxID=2282170 RepID=UPI000E0DF46D|nr:hypothetical protein [Kordia sp. SMS9]AXG69135.1 hypothetical protein KORDIASMS9_01354 [Kordia sp. SMS9]